MDCKACGKDNTTKTVEDWDLCLYGGTIPDVSVVNITPRDEAEDLPDDD